MRNILFVDLPVELKDKIRELSSNLKLSQSKVVIKLLQYVFQKEYEEIISIILKV